MKKITQSSIKIRHSALQFEEAQTRATELKQVKSVESAADSVLLSPNSMPQASLKQQSLAALFSGDVTVLTLRLRDLVVRELKGRLQHTVRKALTYFRDSAAVMK
jgi:hypothetical protein